MSLPDWLSQMDPTLAAAIVGATFGFTGSLVAIPLRYYIDRRALRHRLKLEYEQEQRAALKRLVVRYLGRMLEACNSFNHRMWNLYKGPQQESYLAVEGDFSTEHYYLDSMVHRFLGICILLRGFEKEAMYLDPRLIGKDDVDLNRLLQAMRWSLTDAALFDGLSYDTYRSTDHFFADELRWVSEDVMDEGELKPRHELRERAANEASSAAVYSFFDGLSSSEERYRWDRVVVFHLFVMAFLNSYGDETQRASASDLANVAGQIRRREIARNVMTWIPKLGLDKLRRGKEMVRALEKRIRD